MVGRTSQENTFESIRRGVDMRALCVLFQPGAQRGGQVRFVPNYRYFAHPILRNFVV